jgi:SAM-dependent methyltransferase
MPRRRRKVASNADSAASNGPGREPAAGSRSVRSLDARSLLALDRDPRLARYMGEPGAVAYATKRERSWLRRFSNEREKALVSSAFAALRVRGKILDVPCGAGRLTPVLLERAVRVAGADVSPAMLAQARRALAGPLQVGRVELVRASIANLPFDDGEFDAALCWRLLHHLPEPSLRVRALAEVRRVTRGPLVASFADRDTWKSRIRRTHRADRHAVALSRDDLEREARQGGWVLRDCERLASFFSHLACAILTPA